MHRLTRIIGPAPSELSEGELLARIRVERERVSKTLQGYMTKPQRAKKPAKGKTSKSMKMLLEELGLTEEEFLAAKRDLEETQDD